MEKQRRLDNHSQRVKDEVVRELSLRFVEMTRGPQSPPDLVSTFTKLYYFLYTNSSLPRAERLAAEMVRLLFCKLYDEKANSTSPAFRVYSGEIPKVVVERLRNLLEVVKEEYSDVFAPDERLLLDDRSIVHVVETLQGIRLLDQDRDAVGDAFEAIIGPALRGEKGQFFTPRNVVRLCVESLDPKPDEAVMDPACGSGGFLIVALERVWKSAGADAEVLIAGVDKEVDLVRICKAYMAMIGDGRSGVICTDSLADFENTILRTASYDVILTNPPFGARIPIIDPKVLVEYQLGHRWVRDGARWARTDHIQSQPPQILFVERCLDLLRPGGRMAIVLPEGLFGNASDGYLVQFILNKSKILGVVSCPHETFQPSTHTKTSVLFLERNDQPPSDYPIFMAIAQSAGHDKNGKPLFKMDREGSALRDDMGRPIVDDDLPEIAAKLARFIRTGKIPEPLSRLGFLVTRSRLMNNILVPQYYDPEVEAGLEDLRRSSNYRLVSIGELVRKKAISIKRGNEVGSRFYGTGEIPFVRTTDLVNWEIRFDPIKSVSEEVYQRYRVRQDLREEDILIVNDGTFLIGRTAMVTRLDQRIVIQSHVRRIRVENQVEIDPYLLFYLLNTRMVARQVQAKTFVQATISTLGNRLLEIVLPVPKSADRRKQLSGKVRAIIGAKINLREETQRLLDL